MPRPVLSAVCAVTACFVLSGSPCRAQTYTADQFKIESWIGKTVRMDGWETETETRIWLGEGPVSTPWSGTRSLRILPANEVIDGHPTNAAMVMGDEPPGPPNYEQEPAVLSAAEGWINFGSHPAYTGNREHFTNGITMVPPTMTVGDSFLDARCTTWEGQWDGGQAWTGTCTRTITIAGIEPVTLPTGVCDALRIDYVDDRTKNGLGGDHWATEHWETSFWLLEGVGPVKMTESELKRHYDTFYDNGNSPMSEYTSQSESLFTIVPEPATLGLFAVCSVALIGRRRRRRSRTH